MYEKKLVTVGTLKKGDTIIIDDAPCKIRDVSISRPGKHGHDRVEAPIIEKKTAQILSVSGKVANVMDTESFETFEMEIPEELQATVREGAEVLYWVIMGTRVMKQMK